MGNEEHSEEKLPNDAKGDDWQENERKNVKNKGEDAQIGKRSEVRYNMVGWRGPAAHGVVKGVRRI